MNTSQPSPGEAVKDVRCSEDSLTVDLLDGRTISVPLAWYPRLLHATADQRRNWTVSGAGFGMGTRVASPIVLIQFSRWSWRRGHTRSHSEHGR